MHWAHVPLGDLLGQDLLGVPHDSRCSTLRPMEHNADKQKVTVVASALTVEL